MYPLFSRNLIRPLMSTNSKKLTDQPTFNSWPVEHSVTFILWHRHLCWIVQLITRYGPQMHQAISNMMSSALKANHKFYFRGTPGRARMNSMFHEEHIGVRRNHFDWRRGHTLLLDYIPVYSLGLSSLFFSVKRRWY